MTERFTENAKNVIFGAISAAKEHGHAFVGSEHLLLAIAKTSPKCFDGTNVTYARIKERLDEISGGCGEASDVCELTPKCKKIIAMSGKLASDEACGAISVEHILVSMLKEECVARRMLESDGVSVNDIIMSVGGDRRTPSETVGYAKAKEKDKARPTPYLDKNGRDLTAEARSGGIEEISCRDAEEERLIRILMRKTKNNPCLIGDAGVGKTAIAESMAKRIAEGRVPDRLKDMRVISVDVASVVAGTKYRGEFEEKLKNVINDAKNNNVILFIDELHTIVGAGSAEGSVDASNILKPYLARGEIHVIGATTATEYRRIIGKDPALERRFQPVEVKEPSESECAEMLEKTKKYYESHHGVIITESAVKAAVKISSRFISGRKLPDKAIDLIDEAASETVIRGGSILDGDAVTDFSSSVIGVPRSLLTGTPDKNASSLFEKMKETVTGRDEALSSLSRTFARYLSGRKGKAPVSVLISGKRGSGKTFLSDEFVKRAGFASVLRYDMSEYTEYSCVSRFLCSGAVGDAAERSPGEKIRSSPFSAIIFDCFEKAHPDMASLVTSMITGGSIPDSAGEAVPLSSAFVIILTSEEKRRGSGFTDSAYGDTDGIHSAVSEEIELKKLDDAVLYAITRSRFLSLLPPSSRPTLTESAEKRFEDAAHELKEPSFCVRFAEKAACDVVSHLGNDGKSAEFDVICENGAIKIKIPEKSS